MDGVLQHLIEMVVFGDPRMPICIVPEGKYQRSPTPTFGLKNHNLPNLCMISSFS